MREHVPDQLRKMLQAIVERIPRSTRRMRGLVLLVVVLGLTLTTVTVLGTIAQAHSGALAATATTTPVLSRADFHSTSLYHGEDLELNVAISQSSGDCQAVLNGGYCLRYSVVQDLSADCDTAVMAGYGVIPAADVVVTSTSVTITVDTGNVPHFVHTVGIGGPISISWKTATSAGKIPSSVRNTVHAASTQGGIASYPVPNTGVIAAIIYK